MYLLSLPQVATNHPLIVPTNLSIKRPCCYRTSTGSNLGESYCQTCTINPQIDQASTCDQPELQFRSTSGNVPGDDDDDNNGGVLKD
jgi:hypothetical protein